jgi:hypothetical protein
MAILWRHRHAVYSSSLYTNERWARFSLYSRIIPGIIINEMRSSYIYLQWCCTHPVVDGSEESGLRQQAKAHFYPCIYRMTDYLYCGPSSYVYLEFLMQSEVYIVIYIQRFYISTLSCAYRYYIMDGSSSLGSLMAFGGLLSLPHTLNTLLLHKQRRLWYRFRKNDKYNRILVGILFVAPHLISPFLRTTTKQQKGVSEYRRKSFIDRDSWKLKSTWTKVWIDDLFLYVGYSAVVVVKLLTRWSTSEAISEI